MFLLIWVFKNLFEGVVFVLANDIWIPVVSIFAIIIALVVITKALSYAKNQLKKVNNYDSHLHDERFNKLETKDYDSYINNDMIFLSSIDFHLNTGQQWIVDIDTLTIKDNRHNRVKRLPFNEIKNIKLYKNQISYSVLVRMNNFYSAGLWEDEIIMQEPLVFHPKDTLIAQAVNDRILQYISNNYC